MNRMWEIREGYISDHDRYCSIRSAEDKAYDCGFEDGYKKAMEEFHSEYSDHRSSRRY